MYTISLSPLWILKLHTASLACMVELFLCYSINLLLSASTNERNFIVCGTDMSEDFARKIWEIWTFFCWSLGQWDYFSTGRPVAFSECFASNDNKYLKYKIGWNYFATCEEKTIKQIILKVIDLQ